MPTYDYICESCGYKFEQFQSITAKSLQKCPKCGTNQLKRVIGAGAGIIFKGSGFYQTDYRSTAYKNAEKSETSTCSSGDKGRKADKNKTTGRTKQPESKTKTNSKADKSS